MKLNTFAPKKSRAQAMVEFAIVLPLLLLLVYGLLEAGRLLFMYSSIVTASRQASRYGAATGDGTTPGVPRYQDCAGIRLAANRVDFLNSFDHEGLDIGINWDSGPATTPNPICPAGSASENWTPTDNENRLLVTVTGHFSPIVPRIVPFLARTIEATSARTIVTGVEIYVSPPPGSGIPTAGTSPLLLAMTASPTTYAFAGEVINFTYTITNNHTADLSGLVLTVTHGAVSCPGTTLAVSASMTCTGGYVTTDADVTAGSISAQGSATGTDGTNTITSNTATVVLDWVELPELTLDKAASTEYAPEGGTIVYTFTLTNSGNVPLTGVTVSDPPLGGAIAGCGGDLAVGAPPLTCTTNYVVTASNVNDEELVNSATASATYGTQTITSNTASVRVWTGPLFLRASASPSSLSAPGTITYTYELINNTGVILHPPYTISGHRGTENCSTSTTPIPIGGSITCTGTYTVTQPDLDNNASLDNNSLRVTGCSESNNGNCPGARRVTSNTRSVNVTLVRNPDVSLAILNITPNPATTLGSVITFTYSIGNTGNVTLLSPTITDTRATGIACPLASLAPSTAQTCTGTYTVNQQDLDDGSFSGQATANATFNSQTVSSISQPYTITTFVGPRLRLQITPNPTTYTGVGQFIVYAYTLRNTGSVPLFGPFSAFDNKVTFVDCLPATSPLAVGASTSCVGSYATTQADMDAGNIINSANVTGSDGTQVVQSNSAMAVVYVPGAPTITPSPTNPAPPTTPSPVTGCGNMTTSVITTPNDTMVMTITNPNAYAVTVSNVEVSWNPSGGTGNPSTLTLQNARLGSTTFFTGNNNTGSLTITPSTTLTIPANSAPVITFTFDKNYVTESGESIVINLSTSGCESTPIHRP